MHRKHVRATVDGVDIDIPISTFGALQYLFYNGEFLTTAELPENIVSGVPPTLDNAIARWNGTSGTSIQNSLVIISDTAQVTGVTALNGRDIARWTDGPSIGGATDNAVARWDTTTGRLLQNSVVVIDDTGAITGVTSINTIPVNDFVRGPTPAVAVDDHIATWDGTSGRLIQDSGLHIGNVNYITASEVTSGHLPEFADSAGRRLVDSGLVGDHVVQSPLTSTDNAVARYDGTTGKFIQNSVVIISDTGAITGVTSINGSDLDFVRGPTPAASVNHNVTTWDGVSGRLIQDSGLPVGNVVYITDSEVNTGHLPEFANSLGRRITDSGIVSDNVVQTTTGTVTDNSVVRFDGTTGRFIQSSTVIISDAGAITGVTTINGYTLGAWGDVTGPSSSTDNRIARFDGASGKVIQNSLISITDGGNVFGIVELNGLPIDNYCITNIPATTGRVAVYNGTNNIFSSAMQFAGTTLSGFGNITITSTLTAATVTTTTLNVSGNLNGRDPDEFVVGPGGATDNRVARFDGTTGYLIQNSAVTIDDAGAISGITTINTIDPSLWVRGPASSTGGMLVSWNGTSGRSLNDSSVPLLSVVTGPASATDNRIARFDGTTGKLIQQSAVTLDDSGNLTGVGTINGVDITAGYIRGIVSAASGTVNATGLAAAAVLPPTAGDWLLTAFFPYGLIDTGGNCIVRVSWASGTGSAGINFGSVGAISSVSNADVAFSKSSISPSGLIIVNLAVTGFTSGNLQISLLSSGTNWNLYRGGYYLSRDP